MSRFDYPDPGTDPAYCDGLSDPPEPPDICDNCNDAAADIYSAGGRFVFCSDQCRREWELSCDEEN